MANEDVNEANLKMSTSDPQIHLSARDGKTTDEATQIVFHKMADKTLFIEIFPHNSKKHIYTYDLFTLSEVAKQKLIEFLNNPNTYNG